MTPLESLQAALGALVTSPQLRARAGEDAGALAPFGLAAPDEAWLRRLVHEPGFRFTCTIQRSWCELRTRGAARWTLRAIEPELRRALVDEWLDGGGGRGSFFAAEAAAFLAFVAARLPDGSPVKGVCDFERAAIVADSARLERAPVSPATLSDDARIVCHPGATLVELHTPPAELLGALFAGAPLPPLTDDVYPLLFAPALPGTGRMAQPLEARIFARCTTGASLAELRALDEGQRTIDELFAVAAITPAH